MAKRRSSSASGVRIVKMSAPRAAAPIIRVSAPRAAPAKRRRGRARHYARAAGGFVSQHNIDMFIGGAGYGFLVRSGMIDRLPAIPIIGRTGTAAIVLDYFSKRGGGGGGGIVARMATSAAVLAGYQLGHDGKITGDVEGLQTTGDSFSTAGDE